MTRYFVTGTDTGVGKTVVASALLARARSRGQRAFGFKPAESDCSERDGELHPEDAALLARCAGHAIACPFRYQAPLAPAAAALAEGNPLRPDEVGAIWQREAAAADFAVAEGAGGLLVPLAPGYLVSDLVADLDCPLLIVARDNLGTINHTALTIEVARGRGLEVIGFVFSSTGEVSPRRAASNARDIAEITGAAYRGALPRVASFEPDALSLAARAIDLP